MLYALALSLLLAVVLTVAAVRRADRRRLGLRIGAGLLAVAGLWLAAFPPSRSTPTTTSQEVILLTNRYSADTLRQLLRQLGSDTHFWRYGGLASSDTSALSNLAALRQRFPALRRVHVVGQGLPAADLAALKNVRIISHAPVPRASFQAATWNNKPELGQPWAAEGAFAHAKGPVWIILRAAGARRDSVQLASGQGVFRLRFTPKAEGRAVYALEARQGNKLLAQEPVPLEVLPSRPLRVLLLAAAPSFEIRFLKNYLAANQHSVALRTGLSRGLTQTEFLNFSTAPDLGRLTPSLLARFNVLIADAGALAALSGAEAEALAQAVRAGSCGALLLADAAAVPRQLPGRVAFQLLPRPTAASTSQPVRWPEAPGTATTVLAATLRAGTGLRTLVTDARQQLAAAVHRVGMGQVVVTTAVETFPWQLQGQAATYESYWSHLLTAVAPPRSSAASIELLTSWPQPNTPLSIRTVGVAPGLLKVAAAGGSVVRAASRQDAYVPEWATSTYWPDSAGWHLAQTGAAQTWFYVFSSEQWQAPLQQEWKQVASSFNKEVSVLPAHTSATSTRTSWSRWWGYALFILGAGLLWLEEKL